MIAWNGCPPSRGIRAHEIVEYADFVWTTRKTLNRRRPAASARRLVLWRFAASGAAPWLGFEVPQILPRDPAPLASAAAVAIQLPNAPVVELVDALDSKTNRDYKTLANAIR
jgi:hypothetical protein